MSSLTTERTFSIRTGLAASTVTPGSTAPDVSLTTPVMAACANAAAGSKQDHQEGRHRSPRDNYASCSSSVGVSREDREWDGSHESRYVWAAVRRRPYEW